MLDALIGTNSAERELVKRVSNCGVRLHQRVYVMFTYRSLFTLPPGPLES